ncbi:hypothetical protein AMAG_11877 [Allomyces macrogynus ATCC 38327]|uniref:RRM domain-containing protein n=1 Tax=Allomyces macrogynus (strain ATCC 38327) TaxID=578462 RepID=A0A0L0SXY0_ALLM3|nr:hypothetical protein AMAG_11877 [Allomyces macrogynus ATCC 38327]|eukprot:KNE67413.1 hypothetical protein AMAG_11877 [Allomyces macrogynus ATCC 38327]
MSGADSARWQHDLFDKPAHDLPDRAGARVERSSRQAAIATTPVDARMVIEQLHFTVTEKDLLELFAAFDITSAFLRYDSTDRSTGIADLFFATADGADRARNKYDGMMLDDKAMVIRAWDKFTDGGWMDPRAPARRGNSNNDWPPRGFDRRTDRYSGNGGGRHDGGRGFSTADLRRGGRGGIDADRWDRDRPSYRDPNDLRASLPARGRSFLTDPDTPAPRRTELSFRGAASLDAAPKQGELSFRGAAARMRDREEGEYDPVEALPSRPARRYRDDSDDEDRRRGGGDDRRGGGGGGGRDLDSRLRRDTGRDRDRDRDDRYYAGTGRADRGGEGTRYRDAAPRRDRGGERAREGRRDERRSDQSAVDLDREMEEYMRERRGATAGAPAALEERRDEQDADRMEVE